MSLDALQYGALGILLIVLGAMFTLVKRFLDGAFAQSEAWFDFVKDEIVKANIERGGQIEAWHETVKDSIRTSVSVASSLEQINKVLEDQKAQSREILEFMRRRNGKEGG